ncbi:MAG: hypothetical protein LBF81_02440, partial [Prevotellaceae bacterium]|nr:hypothetical protein [Prevotellaceae bacterium]
TRYFSVPVRLLRGLISGEKPIKEFTSDVVDYSLYYHAKHSLYGEKGEKGGYNSIETQMRAAGKFLHVKIGNIDTVIHNGEGLYNQYQKENYCGINTNIIWDYKEHNKTDYQIALFCAFCATRSIIGKSEYKKTNIKMIVARMFGYNNYSEMVADTPNITAKNVNKRIIESRKKEIAEREKYLTRYHYDKILSDLEIKWGLKRYSDHTRGMLISYILDYGKLAEINESSKKIVQIVRLKELKEQARIKAKQKYSK